MTVQTIACQSGKVFSQTLMPEDRDWKNEVAYYRVQGCIIDDHDEPVLFESCDCDHCKTLSHDLKY